VSRLFLLSFSIHQKTHPAASSRSRSSLCGEGAITNMEQVADYIRESLDHSATARFPTLFMIDDACSTIAHLLAELARLARGDRVSHESWCILLLCAIDFCVDAMHHPNPTVSAAPPPPLGLVVYVSPPAPPS